MVDLSHKTKGRSVDMGRISLPCLYDGPRMINKKLDDLLSLLDFIWVQCFETYMAVFTSTQPTKSKELLAYQPSLSERLGGVVVRAGWHMTQCFGSRWRAIQRWNGQS